MFSKDKLTYVKGSTFKTDKSSATKVTAAMTGSGASSLNVGTYASGSYNFWMSGLLPATPDLPDTTSLSYFYRDIYNFDNVGGSVVDILSVFPFSAFEMRGLEEKELDIYETAVERLNIQDMLPQTSIAYLTDGFFCGSLVYDPDARNFMDTLIHDALQCNVTPSPFNNIDPSVRVTVSGPTRQFLSDTSDYAKRYIKSMPRGFVDLLKEGAFTLDPLTTLFIGRRGLTDRAYQSYLHRLLPMYLIEKSMYRGTLVEATRRQRAMSHVMAGDDVWTPTSEELRILVDQFQMAEKDPLGGWISTRNSIQVQDLRPGGDFWKWTDMSDTLTPYKLRALGVSEALLSGDASFAAAESSYSTFLETANSYREHLTNAIFYKKLFPIIAVANGLFKDKKAKQDIDPIDFLFNQGNRNKLLLPQIHWHKDLSGHAEETLMDQLEKLTEHEVPVPLKMWLAAAGIDKDTLIRDHNEDKELRKALGMAPVGAGAQDEDSDEDGGGELSNEEGEEGGDEGADLEASLTTKALKGFGVKRNSILDRTFSGADVVLSKSGKPVYRSRTMAQKRDDNWKITKMAKAMDDPETRMHLRKQNVAKFGSATLKGVF